jgi:hypothetical protein
MHTKTDAKKYTHTHTHKRACPHRHTYAAWRARATNKAGSGGAVRCLPIDPGLVEELLGFATEKGLLPSLLQLLGHLPKDVPPQPQRRSRSKLTHAHTGPETRNPPSPRVQWFRTHILPDVDKFMMLTSE